MTQGGQLTAQSSTPNGEGGWDTHAAQLRQEKIPALAENFSPVAVTPFST